MDMLRDSRQGMAETSENPDTIWEINVLINAIFLFLVGGLGVCSQYLKPANRSRNQRYIQRYTKPTTRQVWPGKVGVEDWTGE